MAEKPEPQSPKGEKPEGKISARSLKKHGPRESGHRSLPPHIEKKEQYYHRQG